MINVRPGLQLKLRTPHVIYPFIYAFPMPLASPVETVHRLRAPYSETAKASVTWVKRVVVLYASGSAQFVRKHCPHLIESCERGENRLGCACLPWCNTFRPKLNWRVCKFLWYLAAYLCHLVLVLAEETRRSWCWQPLQPLLWSQWGDLGGCPSAVEAPFPWFDWFVSICCCAPFMPLLITTDVATV